MTGWSNTAAHGRRQSLGAVDDDQQRPGHVEAPLSQADEQVGHQRGVLGRALHYSQRVLGAVYADAHGDDEQVVGEVHPVDHEGHQVQGRQVGSQQLGQGGLGGLDEAPGDGGLRCRAAPRPRPSGADRLEACPVAAGGQLGHHLGQGHLAQQLGGAEQVVGGDGDFARAVGGPHPGPAHPDAPAAEGHRPVFGPVADGAAPGVMLALGPAQGGHRLLHQAAHYGQAGTTAMANRPSLIVAAISDLFSDEHASAAFEDEQRIIRTGEAVVAKVERETFRDRPDAWVSTTKLPLRDDDGRIVGTFGISRDVTAQVLAEQALAHQALHDGVTGLANRLALMDRLAQCLLALDRRQGRVGLFFVALDNFKVVNDTYGHDAGDRVLVEVGRRLGRISRRADTVARFGGDEFVLLRAALHDDNDARLIASRTLRAIGGRFVHAGRDLTVTASIGVAVTDDALAEPGVLLRQADAAHVPGQGRRARLLPGL